MGNYEFSAGLGRDQPRELLFNKGETGTFLELYVIQLLAF